MGFVPLDSRPHPSSLGSFTIEAKYRYCDETTVFAIVYSNVAILLKKVKRV